jgi:hypothetical protein
MLIGDVFVGHSLTLLIGYAWLYGMQAITVSISALVHPDLSTAAAPNVAFARAAHRTANFLVPAKICLRTNSVTPKLPSAGNNISTGSAAPKFVILSPHCLSISASSFDREPLPNNLSAYLFRSEGGTGIGSIAASHKQCDEQYDKQTKLSAEHHHFGCFVEIVLVLFGDVFVGHSLTLLIRHAWL